MNPVVLSEIEVVWEKMDNEVRLIFLQRPNISMPGELHDKLVWSSFLQSSGCCGCTEAVVC